MGIVVFVLREYELRTQCRADLEVNVNSVMKLVIIVVFIEP